MNPDAQPWIETVRGSHHEMGRQMGEIFRHVIRGDLATWAMRHDFEGSAEYLDERLAPRRRRNEAFAPWIDEELRGMAETSGVDPAWLHRLNLRCWEIPRLPPAGESAAPAPVAGSSGCTGIGMLCPEEGVVVGGNLDCTRPSYALLRRLPKDGYAHVTVARVAGIWNQNGLNEAGLFMASNGTGAHPGYRDPDPQLSVPNGTINRLILETCRNVPEAVALIRRSHVCHSFVLGDAEGNLVAVQSMLSLCDVQDARDHGGMVFCTNHFFMPGVVGPLRAQGCEPHMAEKSRVRFEVLERARAAGLRTPAALDALLRSHEGFPNSICNNLSAMSLLASPQRRRHELLVADMLPCRHPRLPVTVHA